MDRKIEKEVRCLLFDDAMTHVKLVKDSGRLHAFGGPVMDGELPAQSMERYVKGLLGVEAVNWKNFCFWMTEERDCAKWWFSLFEDFMVWSVSNDSLQTVPVEQIINDGKGELRFLTMMAMEARHRDPLFIWETKKLDPTGVIVPHGI